MTFLFKAKVKEYGESSPESSWGSDNQRGSHTDTPAPCTVGSQTPSSASEIRIKYQYLRHLQNGQVPIKQITRRKQKVSFNLNVTKIIFVKHHSYHCFPVHYTIKDKLHLSILCSFYSNFIYFYVVLSQLDDKLYEDRNCLIYSQILEHVQNVLQQGFIERFNKGNKLGYFKLTSMKTKKKILQGFGYKCNSFL